jgi:SAM-dependent methyltransferase
MQAFKLRAPRAKLAQADGCALPFANRTFDGVLLVQIFGGLTHWRALIDETLRVLRPGGALLLGRTMMPDDGIDARMKCQLDLILKDHIGPDKINTRLLAEHHLEERAVTADDCDAASWRAMRSPQGFLDRHAAGAQFNKLPLDRRALALRQLSDWAVHQFGTLDARFAETHRFTLRAFTFSER